MAEKMTGSPDLQKWYELAEKELKGSPDRLFWHMAEGITVKPLYTAEDLADNDTLGSHCPGSTRSYGGPRAIMYAGRPSGQSPSMRAFPRQKNQTPFTARRFRRDKRNYLSLLTLPRTADMILITHG